MDEHLYTRQRALDLAPIPTATIIGVGGTGSWTALLLAMAGCQQLNLFDLDRVEYHNLNRLPLEPASVGKPKVAAIAELIGKLRPGCVVNFFGKATPFELDTIDAGVLFDCTDNQTTQTTLFEWAKRRKVRYIRVGYDGTHLTVTSHNSTWTTTTEARTGYEIVPSWVVGAALPACIGVAKAMYAPDIEASFDIKNIGGLK